MLGCVHANNQQADLVTRELNSMPGVQSLPVEGAMYAFPQVASEVKAVKAVKAYQSKPVSKSFKLFQNDRKWSSARGVQQL